MRHIRFRPDALTALAIFCLIGLVGLQNARLVGAEPADRSVTARGEAPGQRAKTADAAHREDSSRSGATSRGGRQVCDGDPSGKSNDGHGANKGGADDQYEQTDATCGPQSANGEGDGGATGRPEAGQVGNADDKNPPGQRPNGGDPNAGYECDGNKGIAAGNPAHTRSCLAALSDPPPPPPPPPPPSPVPPSPRPGPGGPALVPTIETPRRAAVIDDPATPTRPAEVLGIQLSRGDVLGAGLARTGPATLTAALLRAGVALLLLGAGLLLGLRAAGHTQVRG